MGHDTLENHYKSNFALMHHHKWSITEIEKMMPWEKLIYVDLLKAHIKAEEERIRDLRNEQRGRLNKRVKM